MDKMYIKYQFCPSFLLSKSVRGNEGDYYNERLKGI